MEKGEIILYQPDNSIQLEVRMESETVWLTQAQMAGNVHFLHIPFSDKPVKYYSLDVIISVGYRVKSQRGTDFRRWANKIIKEYLLRGYVVNQRIERLEQRVTKTEEKIDFFVRTSLSPAEGVYVWKVIADGKLAETGKRIKELFKEKSI